MERERVVEISTGEVTVGQLQWSGYRRIKTGILQFVGDKLASILRDSFAALPGGIQINPAMAAVGVVPALTVAIGESIDKATIDILEACGVPRATLDAASAIDVILLREAANEINQIERLIDAEKNLLGGLVSKALKTVGFSLPSLKNSGGPDGSQSSSVPDGSGERSSEPQ